MYEVYAIRYATFAGRRSYENFIQRDVHDGPMPLDFYIWLIRDGERNILVDTGFNRSAGERRNRKLTISPEIALQKMDVDPSSISDVIITHLHFDHVGWNTRLLDGKWVVTFPNARYLFGRLEWDHWSAETGPYMNVDETVRPAEALDRRVIASVTDSRRQHLRRDRRGPARPGIHAQGHRPRSAASAARFSDADPGPSFPRRRLRALTGSRAHRPLTSRSVGQHLMSPFAPRKEVFLRARAPTHQVSDCCTSPSVAFRSAKGSIFHSARRLIR